VITEQIVYRDWRTSPPGRRIQATVPAAQEPDFALVPAADAEVSLDDLAALGLKPEQLRVRSTAGWWTALFFLALLGVTGLVGWMVFRAERSREPHLAAEAEKLFREGNYSQALNKYRDLQRQFPGSVRRAEYSFYEQASLLRALLSNPRADVHRLSGLATQFLRNYRHSPQFAQYRRELAEALYQVARRAGEEARRNLDRLLLEQVQEIYAALQEIGFGLGEMSVRSNELSQAIQQADYAIRLAEARNRLQLAIQAAMELRRPTLVEQAQRLFDQLRREFAELGSDAEIAKQLAHLLHEESAWLGHLGWPACQAALDWSLSAEGMPGWPILAVVHSLFVELPAVWNITVPTPAGSNTHGGRTTPAPDALRSGDWPVVLADGFRLLALQTSSGRVAWTASLPGEKKLRVLYRESAPPRFYVWAEERRLLSLLDPTAPQVLWTIRVPGYAPFAPTVAPPYWWLADPRGWVWYGETKTGQVLGAFWLDYPLLPTVSVHPLTGIACVGTYKKRTFLLDAHEHRAVVLRDEHEEGSLAGPALPLLSGLLLPATQKEQLQLLGLRWRLANLAAEHASPPWFRSGQTTAAGELTQATVLLQWPGRRLLDAVSTGELAVLVSDRYDLVLAQTVRDSPVPAQVLGKSKWSLAIPVALRNTGARIVILGERLGDWWLAGPGVLLRLHWDDYREQLRQETFTIPPGTIRDFAWDDRFPNRLILLLSESDGVWRALAWDIATATLVWQTTGKGPSP